MRRFLSLFTMLMLCGVLAFAQNRVVSGKVTNKDGDPVPFSTIKIKGSNTGTNADASGSFAIRVKDGTVLEISAAGYTSSEVNVGTKSTIVEVLELSGTSTKLTEVVVTALGIKRQAKELGYSTTRVTNNEVNQAKVINLASGLSSKVSGLQVNLTNNGVKNNNTRIILRGNRSITGDNQALLVVDDIQVPTSFIGTLNPNDVESVNILKGSSASALYGSSASNGVIIITTKKGTRGKPIIKLSSTANFETIAYMPDFQNDFGPWGGEPLNAPGNVLFPYSPYVPYTPYENQNFGPRYNGLKVPIGPPIRVFRNDGSYFIAQDSTLYSAKPNAKRDFFDKALTWTNDVSYSGGDDKSKFFFSFQDVNQGGTIPGDVARRNTIRANGSREYGKLSVNYNVGYTIGRSNTTAGNGTNVPFSSTNGIGGTFPGGGSYFQNRNLYFIVINQPSMVDLRDYRNWQNNPYANPDGYFNAYYGNPWWGIDQSRIEEKNNDVIANFGLGYKVADWLDLTYRAGIVRNDYNTKYTKQGYNFAAWAIADTLGAGNIPSGVKVLSPNEGDAFSYSQVLTSDLLASVHKTYHSFDFRVVTGASLLINKDRLLSAAANSLIIPGFFNINNRVGEPAVSELYHEFRRNAVFGDLTIGFKNYLFLHGSVRNDWNSLLTEQFRSFAYPAADISFVFTDAIKSLNNNKVLSFGKIRGAISKTGNISSGTYATQNTFGVGAGFPFGGVGGFSVSNRFNNPNLKPEFTTDKEIGLELGFLKNRINLGVAVYQANTTNQTIPITITPTTGGTSAIVNSGEMLNRGIEVDLKVTPLAKTRSGFRWDVGANFSYNQNTLLSLGYGLPEIPVQGAFAIVGKAYPQLKVSDWKRDDQNRIIVDKLTGYPSLANDPVALGTSNPPMKVGINTSLSFKGFSFSVQADGRFGAIIDNSIGNSLDFTGVSAYSAQSGRQSFVIPNTVYFDGAKYVPNTNISTKDGNLAFWASTWNTAESNYINSADFWKLREIAFGYTFPKKLMTGFIKDVSMQITGRNLFVQRAKENVWSDPEFSNTTGNGGGITGLNELPPTKFVSFSLNLTF